MLKDINGKKIVDIITVGAVSEEKNSIEYFPDLRTIYIEIDDGYIKFISTEQYSRMNIEFVDSIDYLYEIDDDMSYAKSSILDIVLVGRYMEGNIINNIIYYGKEENMENINCKACEIILDNGEIIFLDPSFLCGISIGGIEKKKYFFFSNDNS